MQGNSSDVATLRTTMKEMVFLGAKPVHIILDRRFYSEANVGELLERRHHFTVAAPSVSKWVESAIDRHYESISSPEHHRQIDDSEALYAVTELRKGGEGNRRVYLHVYYNARQGADEFNRLTRELLQYRQELEFGREVEYPRSPTPAFSRSGKPPKEDSA